MASTVTSPVQPIKDRSTANAFLILLGAFLLLALGSLPLLLSFDLWVMGDKSSFLNLDYLFAKHYRLGVDACYSYGLLPVFIQHCLFVIFGRGYKPVLGSTFVALAITAYFWSLLRRSLPEDKIWLFTIAALSPLVLLVSPNLPYIIVILSMLFALWLVLLGRLDAAMAVSAVGCFGVPSLSLMLTGLLGASIVVDWWTKGERNFIQLLRRIAPGVAVYILLFAGMSAFFGFSSMAATALPTNGIRFYKSTGWFGLDACLQFLHPSGYHLKYYLAYYIFSPVTWFVLSSMVLAFFALQSAWMMARQRRIDSAGLFFVLCCVVIFVFFFFAFGGRGQQEIYQPVLFAGTLVAISRLPLKVRTRALIVFLVLGVLGEAGQAYKTLVAWRTTRPEPNSFGLYVNPGFASELGQIVDSSKTHNVLMLSYATGEHSYYPTLQTPDMWFLQPGLMFKSDRQRVLNQIDNADFVVEDLTRFHFFQDYDPDVRPRLAAMCLVSTTENFRIYRRPNVEPGPCQLNAVMN